MEYEVKPHSQREQAKGEIISALEKESERRRQKMLVQRMLL
jgi:hypothetical protein